MVIKIRPFNKDVEFKIPSYATEHSSGMDLSSASPEDITIGPMQTVLIPTNIIIEIPPGYEGQVRPRSGLALRNSIGIINSPGTIDADYRGEVRILLTNFGSETFTVRFGDRIAQLIISKVEKADIVVDDDLTDTTRSSGGFGHTGI